MEVVNKLTPEREAMNLWRHGTAKLPLTANAVFCAARQDLQARDHNAWLSGERARMRKEGGNLKSLALSRPLGFLRSHVAHAKTPADVLRNAVAGIEEGRRRAKTANTLRLYDSEEILRAALKMAEAA